jgi:hypothetical protein
LNIGRKFFHIARDDFGLLWKGGHLSDLNVSAQSILSDDHWLWVSLRFWVSADATLYQLSQYNALWTHLRQCIDSSSLVTCQDLVSLEAKLSAAPSSAIISVDEKPYDPGEEDPLQSSSPSTLPPLPKDRSSDNPKSLDPSGLSDNDSSYLSQCIQHPVPVLHSRLYYSPHYHKCTRSIVLQPRTKTRSHFRNALTGTTVDSYNLLVAGNLSRTLRSRSLVRHRGSPLLRRFGVRGLLRPLSASSTDPSLRACLTSYEPN